MSLLTTKEILPVTIKLHPAKKMSDEEFFEFCQLNKDVSFERNHAEYLENGAKLGWLIDPQQQKVYIYRPNCDGSELDNPVSLSGEEVLPGFVLELQDLGF